MPNPDLWTAWETKNAATMRRIKLSENPAYALEGSITPERTLIERAMIEAEMMGRRLKRIAKMVEIKIVNKIHAWCVIPKGGGVKIRNTAKSKRATLLRRRFSEMSMCCSFSIIISLEEKF